MCANVNKYEESNPGTSYFGFFLMMQLLSYRSTRLTNVSFAQLLPATK